MRGQSIGSRRLLAETPSLALANIYTASMLGEVDAVRAMIEKDPTLATRKGGPKDWEPLLYVSASRFHQESRERAAGIIGVVQLLLANGADPDSFYLWEGDGKSNNRIVYGDL